LELLDAFESKRIDRCVARTALRVQRIEKLLAAASLSTEPSQSQTQSESVMLGSQPTSVSLPLVSQIAGTLMFPPVATPTAVAVSASATAVSSHPAPAESPFIERDRDIDAAAFGA
jgi:hypothetical protein